MDGEDLRIRALMSFPRVGFTENFGLTNRVLFSHGIELAYSNGAYWGQCLQTLMEEALDEGYDWLLTIDYDTVMSNRHMDQLLDTFAANPHIDALAAMQSRRGSNDTPLMIIAGEDEVVSDGSPIRVDTAHFGLTLFRAERFAELPKPWFVHQPDENGSYRHGKQIDDDIYFWHHWKTHGRTLYVDPLCRIGHLQQVVTDVDPSGKQRHRFVHQWRAQEIGT